MRVRPIRPFIYKPILWFGVALGDWKFVVIFVALAYAIPFYLDLKLFLIPLPLLSSILALVLSIAFFNWARLGRRPYWLQHNIQALIQRSQKKRRALPIDRRGKNKESWILDIDKSKAITWIHQLKNKGRKI